MRLTAVLQCERARAEGLWREHLHGDVSPQIYEIPGGRGEIRRCEVRDRKFRYQTVATASFISGWNVPSYPGQQIRM